MKSLLLVCLIGYATAFDHPYLGIVSQEIDSEEHGVTPGTKSTSCKCGWANKVTSRIVGGEETQINQFPFIVGIMPRENYYIFCGGTILTSKHVITAAHCTLGMTANQLSIIAGEHNAGSAYETTATEIHNVKYLNEHHDYDPESEANDIAILTLETSITFSQEVGPACLPNARNQFNLIEKYVKVMGWGLTSTNGRGSSVLLHTNIRVIPLEYCEQAFNAYIELVKPTQICTFSNKRDTCQGDSGGPLLYVDPETNRYTLVGLVSYGADCAAEDPAVNTDVAAYLDWIQSTISSTAPGSKTCSSL